MAGLTGKPGVCIATLGPGALNFSTGAAYAHLGAMPMILITGQKAIMSAKQARFQIVDVVASMRPLTKMTRQIVSPASIPAIGARRLPRRDGGAAGAGPSRAAGGYRRRGDRGRAADPGALAGAAGRAGGGARSGGRDDPRRPAPAGDDRRRRQPAAASSSRSRISCARTGLPFFNTQMGKGAVTGGSNLYMRHRRALRAATMSTEAVDLADLILAIGHDTVEKPPFLMRAPAGRRSSMSATSRPMSNRSIIPMRR